MRFLIVEDNHDLRELIALVLRQQYDGCDLFVTNHTGEAYDWLMDGTRFDLVVVDGQLVDGRGSFLVESVIKSPGGPPFLGISGDEGELENLKWAGCRRVLAKPFTLDALIEDVGALCSSLKEEGDGAVESDRQLAGDAGAGAGVLSPRAAARPAA